MRAAVYKGDRRVDVEERPTPALAPDDVLLQVSHCGVCGSDIHVWHGKHPFTPYPVVQGHEVSGIVDAVGAEVRGFPPV